MAKKIYENPQNGYREKVPTGFNIWVLLFGPFWYLFNGMIGKGILWLVVAALVGSFTFGLGALLVWIILAFKANKTREKQYLTNGWKFIRYENEIDDKNNEKRNIGDLS